MKKTSFLFISLLFSTALLLGQKATSTVEVKRGQFITTVRCTANGSAESVSKVMSDFLEQYTNNLPALHKWALKGLKLQGEKDDFIVFNIRSHTPAGQWIAGKMDITIMMIGKTYKDVNYKVKIAKKTKDAQTTEITYRLYECEEVIKNSDAVFTVTQVSPTTCECKMTITTELQGISKMMTKKMFQDNMEGRFRKFVENLAGQLTMDN